MTQRQDIVLIVDDDLAVRESLKFALALDGFAIRLCGSGEELLSHPDLAAARCIVLDYKMPSMDGFEVLAQLDARQLHPPVILITSHASAAIRHHQKGTAGSNLFRGRLVLRRNAPHGVGDRAIAQRETVVNPLIVHAVGETEFGQGRVQKIAGIVARERAARAVGAAQPRRQPDDQQAGLGIAERGDRRVRPVRCSARLSAR